MNYVSSLDILKIIFLKTISVEHAYNKVPGMNNSDS